MPKRRSDIERGAESSPNRLITKTLSAWETEAANEISARTLARSAGLPVSSIYYHFDDLERLLEAAQSEARTLATRWCNAQLDAIGRDIRGAAALGPLLATLIDDWCETQRMLAFAWRECELMALRNAKHVASCAKWDLVWQGFWSEVCGRLDIADVSMQTNWVFSGASSLHMMRWRRPVDRAALGEFCNGWASWLEGRLAEPAAWFELAREDAAALIPPPPPDDPAADAIAEAAAATVAQRGIAALTHRAVATAAGVTLGIVSYKYRTSAELMHAAFEAIYRRMTPHSASEPEAVMGLDRGEALALIAGVEAREDMLATEELLSACMRDSAFGTFAAQLRYLRGRTSGRYFQAMLGRGRPIAPIDAAIFSSLISGRGRSHHCAGRTLPPGVPNNDFAPLLARLDRG